MVLTLLSICQLNSEPKSVTLSTLIRLRERISMRKLSHLAFITIRLKLSGSICFW